MNDFWRTWEVETDAKSLWSLWLEHNNLGKCQEADEDDELWERRPLWDYTDDNGKYVHAFDLPVAVGFWDEAEAERSRTLYRVRILPPEPDKLDAAGTLGSKGVVGRTPVFARFLSDE